MTSPARVSGPGALSQRTDAGGQPIRDLPDPKYGEAKKFEQQQKGAPLAQASGVDGTPPPSKMAAQGEPGMSVGEEPTFELPPGLDDPADPSIPVTAGAAMGDGPNEVMGLPPGAGSEFNPKALKDALGPYIASDRSGILDDIVSQLGQRGMW